MAADSVLNLFRTQKLVPTQNDYDDPDFTPCDFLNESPKLALNYIYHILEKTTAPQERLFFLTRCKRCYQVALYELNEYQANSTYPLYCCGEYFQNNTAEGIKIVTGIAHRLDVAIEETIAQMKDCTDESGGHNHLNLTLHQWVLLTAIAFELLGMDVKSPTYANQVSVARFLHILTCKPCPEAIQNSTLLDYLKNLKNRRGSKMLSDLEAIRPYFMTVGWEDAINKIDNMIHEHSRYN